MDQNQLQRSVQEMSWSYDNPAWRAGVFDWSQWVADVKFKCHSFTLIFRVIIFNDSCFAVVQLVFLLQIACCKILKQLLVRFLYLNVMRLHLEMIFKQLNLNGCNVCFNCSKFFHSYVSVHLRNKQLQAAIDFDKSLSKSIAVCSSYYCSLCFKNEHNNCPIDNIVVC